MMGFERLNLVTQYGVQGNIPTLKKNIYGRSP